MAYVMLVNSKDEEEKWTYRESYKMTRKEAKLAVTEAKSATFEFLYVQLEGKGGIKSCTS